jgi:hypothetical protein
VTSANESLRWPRRGDFGSVRYRCVDLTPSDAFHNLGPTCKKAVDFNDKHVFKSSAFEPTPEAIRNAELAEERVKAESRLATSSPADLTVADIDIMDLTDSSDDELPEPEELFQQSSSQKSSSSQKAIKRLESMKLEDDGFEITGSPSRSHGSCSCAHSGPCLADGDLKR